MSKYYFLSHCPGLTQKDGAFLREDGQICYWVNRFSKGALVTVSDIVRVESVRSKWKKYIYAFLFIGLFASAFGFHFGHYKIHIDLYILALSEPTFHIISTISFILFAGAYLWLALKTSKMVADKPKIDEPRPRSIDYLLIVEARDRSKISFAFALVMFSMIFFGLGGVLIYETWGNASQILGFAIGILCSLFGLIWVFRNLLYYRFMEFSIEDHLPPEHIQERIDQEWKDCMQQQNRTEPRKVY